MADGHSMDNSAINELIPQIFDQMRSSLQRNAIHDKSMNAMVPKKSGSTQHKLNHDIDHLHSAVTIQSLMHEMENLDKLIAMVKNLDTVLSSALPKHLNRIHEVCESTNRMLDHWIDIQSQAGYVHKLMEDENYVKSIAEGNENISEIIKTESIAIEKLKSQVEKATKAKVVSEQTPKLNTKRPYTTSQSRVKKQNVTRSNLPPPKIKTNVRTVGERLSRPTASSSRKNFK